MRTKVAQADTTKGLLRLIQSGAPLRASQTEVIVIKNRKLIRKAMRLGHPLEAIARELLLSKRTLQRHLNNMGLFFRKPRVRKGTVVKKNVAAISRAKMRFAVNV